MNMKDTIIEIRMSDLERLDKNSDVTISDILMLKLISQKDLVNLSKVFEYRVGFPSGTPAHFQFALQKMQLLQSDGYIKLTDPSNPFSFEPLSKLADVFKDDSEENVENWIEDWRNIFPEGKKPGGNFRYRGDKQGCLKNMKWFVKTNPKVTKDEIFTATRKYVKRMKHSQYIKLANYFIKKEGGSLLSSEIEGLTEQDIENYSFTERL